MNSSNELFDYIIIGAGSAGCVLASRLTEDPNIKVLVVEAGGRDWMPLYKVPLLAGMLFRHQYNNWWYETEPEPGLLNRRIRWPRGKVLGGSSQLNGMVYTRGHRLDYDGWRQMGNTGWGYDDVLPYFKKSEDFKGSMEDYHGLGGPLTVRSHGIDNPLYDALIESGRNANFPIAKDFNHPEREGFGRYHFTIKNGRRSSTAAAFLKPALTRPNLKIKTKCLTTKILIEHNSVSGISYIENGHTVSSLIEREVILAGGAINSPQLLLLSGVGPTDHLNELGIPVKHELSGVGQNLHDHLVARMQYATGNVDLYDEFRIDKAARHVFQALLFKTGLGTSFPLEAGCFIKTRPEVSNPNIQCNFVPALIPSTHLPFAKSPLGFKHGFYNGVHQTQPESRGYVKLRSKEPRDPPIIFANYLETENDRKTMREGVQIMRKVFKESPMSNFIKKELQPGPEIVSNDEIDTWIKTVGDTVFHPVGTCKMGTDQMSVVNPQLKVHGLDRIRVSDASIMPVINGSNTNAPTIMIAEKCADMIKNGD